MQKRIVVVALLAVLMLPLFPLLSATAADEAEIDLAITAGMNWLAEQQNPDGSWGSGDQVARTGFAVLKFETHALRNCIDPLDPDYLYYEQVRSGLDYIFAQAYIMPIEVQPAGDPDTDGDGIGVGFGSGTYETSIAMMAIAASTHPELIVDVPAGAVDGWTYKAVLCDAVDWLAFGQTDAGEGRGGWGYVANEGWSDNSNSGYAVLGLAYAEAPSIDSKPGFGCTVPQFVKDELNIWIDYIQNDVDGDTDDGGSGYADPWDMVNILKTGNLLFQMAFVGDTEDTPRVIDAVDYIERHWNDANLDPGWRGLPGEPAHKQAMYTTMKGLEALGIHTLFVDDVEVDWFDEMSTVLVEQQRPDGSWDWDPWGDELLGTEWALLTLQKVTITPIISVSVDVKPGSWPNPLNTDGKGKFGVAICGTENFDVATINPRTVKITIEGVDVGVSALRWNYEDVATPYTGDSEGGHALDGDGYLDLVLHFATQDAVDTLALDAYVGETIPLIIQCNLYPTLTPEQWDTFWSMGDVDRDGYIDVVDIAIIAANFGWSGPPGENPADINIDGAVNILDILICASNQGLDIWTYFVGEPVQGKDYVWILASKAH